MSNHEVNDKAPRKWTLEDAAHLASIAGVVLGLISLWFVYAELRDQSQVIKAGNAQALVELTHPSNLALAKDAELSKLWERGTTNYAGLTDDEKPRYRRLWTMYLNVLENAHFQRQMGLIDERFYATWENDLARNRKPLKEVWPDLKDLVSLEYAQHVDQILAAK